MRERKFYFIGVAAVFLLLLSLAALWGSGTLRAGGDTASAVSGVPNPVDGEGIVPNQPAAASAADPLIFSYAAKYVCLFPIQAGTVAFGPTVPIVEETTEIVIHNPHNAVVDVFKKAVRARFEQQPQAVPSGKLLVRLLPDRSFRIDCDDVAKLLTHNPSATFIGTFGIGVKEEGYVVLHTLRPLDVTGQYRRGSEVLKKDITYQPWWWWWWWPLPWRLGYAYTRMIPIQPNQNIDCRRLVYEQLHTEVDLSGMPPAENGLTHLALFRGEEIDPTNVSAQDLGDKHALVVMTGGCQSTGVPQPGQAAENISYVILSTDGPSDHNPRFPGGSHFIRYPWFPGHWYDLTVVIPQNFTLDLDVYLRDWLIDHWVSAGADALTVRSHMAYFFPWWCGWGGWWWWWWGEDCIDIGVGEGESLDSEQLTPQRVFCRVFPPVDNDGDGRYDEDPPDGINNDGDFNADGTPRIDEDDTEC